MIHTPPPQYDRLSRIMADNAGGTTGHIMVKTCAVAIVGV
jgi:hypothetical protein